ncbi:hypothetical protein [Nocardia shimofusensis]|uniref:hypothetical protein n=1 Tax=Nocardia shimofusensis TaxID=228596 RepID=UPI0012EE92BB|nr:hypothetical protein [Nocardia shimofusensis]
MGGDLVETLRAEVVFGEVAQSVVVVSGGTERRRQSADLDECADPDGGKDVAEDLPKMPPDCDGMTLTWALDSGRR